MENQVRIQHYVPRVYLKNSSKLMVRSIINLSLLDENKIVSQIKEFKGNDSEIIAKNIKENSLSLNEVS